LGEPYSIEISRVDMRERNDAFFEGISEIWFKFEVKE